jgi:hypothetical protein
MRKLIIATAALAFLAATSFSTAFAQDKAGGTTGPAAQSGDTMSKGGDKMSMKKTKKTKKSSKMKEDTAK